ncbi:T9SS type A sorting domain-containing protein [Hymenobacter taeanensis]|uniref:T9SS type A sorting domain-containing protein n=1 Tax=Hymenobacter taeanensis TaxID=2735321 RepID=A0A6M6BDF8_9BACT|nr:MULTISPECIES: T9SS type A sorting domain-containing protein [Hymenobacter]QJX45980.1 T9SS type A sorting domain-containing protein [Hymenobacter taeanensis]UOQ79829.1 T9SS type A sorting domain-containing protein [Hymenobacter sp. 5414T-23]
MNIFTRSLSLALLLLMQLPIVAATVTHRPGGALPWHTDKASYLLTKHETRTWYTLPQYSFTTPTVSFLNLEQSFTQAPTVAVPSSAARGLAPTLSVYPNPARGLVTVSLGQKFTADYKLRLNNIIGREVRTVSLRPEAADGGMALNLSDLPPGMYFYSLVLDNKVMSTKRLVLQN